MTDEKDSAYGYGYCTADGQNVQDIPGLTKREYFAAIAMQGLSSMEDKQIDTDDLDKAVELLCGLSVKLADGLIKALNKEP